MPFSNIILQASQGAPAALTPLSGAGRLLEYGLLGIVTFLLLSALIWVVKQLKAAFVDRILDTQKYANALKEVNDANNQMLTETSASLTALTQQLNLLTLQMETSGRDQKDAIKAAKAEVEKLKDKVMERLPRVQ